MKMQAYNDGVVSIYKEKEENRTNFGAKKNIITTADMKFIANMTFAVASKREQDFKFAESQGFSLSTKIKIRKNRAIDNSCKAVIDGYLYDIDYIDENGTEMFLFLEGVRKIDS